MTSTGALRSHPSCSAVSRRSPGPFSITIASTLAGMPSCGHTSSSAVATQKPTTSTATTETMCQRLRRHQPGRAPARARRLRAVLIAAEFIGRDAGVRELTRPAWSDE
jgi:hypothetical protein